MITADHFNELDQLLKKALENEHLFSEWEQSFIGDWADKLGKQGERATVSDKQQHVFNNIQRKLEKAGEL